MKKIELGTCFSIPLDDNQYGFGYVNYEGQFLMVNIFDFISRNQKDVKLALEKPLLVTDWLIDWVVFYAPRKKLINNMYPAWKLHRNIIYPDYIPPQTPFVIFGGHDNLRCFNFYTGEQHPATKHEIKTYPRMITHHSDYYGAYIRETLKGTVFDDVRYNRERETYIPIVK